MATRKISNLKLLLTALCIVFAALVIPANGQDKEELEQIDVFINKRPLRDFHRETVALIKSGKKIFGT